MSQEEATSEFFYCSPVPGASSRIHEPRKVAKHRVGEPLSVVAFVSDPVKLLLLWGSVVRQTHRPMEFLIVNQARLPEVRSGIRDVYEKIVTGEHRGVDVSYMEGVRRFQAVKRAAHNRVLLIDQYSQLEPGHVESLYETERRTGKRAIASFTVLGEYGGFDAAEILENKSNSVVPTLRFGMFFMYRNEVNSVCRAGRLRLGKKWQSSLGAGFLREYWDRYMTPSPGGRVRSVGTGMATQVVEYAGCFSSVS